MEPVLVDIDQIKPYRANAKLHPQEQIDRIIRSINLTGFDQPIVTDTSYVIIKGHGRLLAAQQMELKQVPVVVLDVPKDVADKARLIDNKSSESGYDLEILLKELSRFQDDNIIDTGYDQDEFKDLMSKLEDDSVIADYDWNSLEGAEKGDDSAGEEGEIVLKFAIPSSMKEAVLEFLNVESDKPAVLGEALIELCCEN
jgi:ParB-like chromosome segregation protein Spo0J